MDYFTLLKFKQEPFSNSPDPGLFFPSFAHQDCMQKVELAVRLKRGLSVVVGAVGTGKTTLCRALIRRFADEDGITTHLFLDPGFGSEQEFLDALLASFTRSVPDGKHPEGADTKEQIKNFLFKQCVEKGHIHLLVIDEGQKIPGFALEILRELLNYETNEYKLLQILIFAQPEFEQTLRERENFMDRASLFYRLRPLTFRETVGFIRFRIGKASEGRSVVRFTLPAFLQVYELTGGYPRRIVHLCHQAILALIIQNKTRVTRSLVTAAASRTTREIGGRRFLLVPLATGMAVGLVFIAAGLFMLVRTGPEGGVTRHAASVTPAPDVASGMPETVGLPAEAEPEDAGKAVVSKETYVPDVMEGRLAAIDTPLKLKRPATSPVVQGRHIKVLRPMVRKSQKVSESGVVHERQSGERSLQDLSFARSAESAGLDLYHEALPGSVKKER